MTNDGSTLGVDAERALETILGGKESPTKDEQASREEVRQRLGKAARLQDIEMRIEERDGEKAEVLYLKGKEMAFSYGGCADVAARAVLDFLEMHPEHAELPMDNEYDWKDYNCEGMPPLIQGGLYETMKQDGYDLGKIGLTGFMWGFAYNTARWLRYEWKKVEGNPAIMEIGNGD